jgi:hypothetical protein
MAIQSCPNASKAGRLVYPEVREQSTDAIGKPAAEIKCCPNYEKPDVVDDARSCQCPDSGHLEWELVPLDQKNVHIAG